MARWQVCVYTSDKFGSGTNANVFIELQGTKGSTARINLDNQGDNFESGKCDVFELETVDVGQLKTLLIGHDNSTNQAGWHLNKVEITNKENGDKTTFKCGRWLADDEEDGKCEIQMKGSTVAGNKKKQADEGKARNKQKETRATNAADDEEREQERYWDLMALAKQKHPKFAAKEDKRTVYWVDKQPAGPPTTIDVSARVEELSNPRTFKVKHRPSPQWNVSDGAKSYEATPRLVQLSAHKEVVPEYRPFRPVLQPISQAAMSANATPRLEGLAQSKSQQRAQSMMIWDHDFLPQPVSESARKAEATPRVSDLSEAKRVHREFLGERSIRWDVSDDAKSATASTRVQQLARPRSRTMMKDTYDPYKVSYGSLHAVSTPRINELCLPLPRKQRSKRVMPTQAI